MHAAIGTDGANRVVWGLGETADDAREDARVELLARATLGGDTNEDDADGLDVVEVSARQAAEIRGGVVRCSELGIGELLAPSSAQIARQAHEDAATVLESCGVPTGVYDFARALGADQGLAGRDLDLYVERFVGHVVNVECGTVGV